MLLAPDSTAVAADARARGLIAGELPEAAR
jgi:hypothetical protein